MGGKTASSQSQVQIPPEVLARYTSVNASAEQAAQQPFQQYSSDPNAFVAPINQQQQTGINTVNSTAGSYAPYFNAASSSINGATNAGLGGTYGAYAPLAAGQGAANGYQSVAAGLGAAGTGAVNAAPIDNQIGRYLNPYLNTVLGGTLAPMIQQQQQQQSGLMGNQILSHTFGGDRAGISQAVLAGQQNLALGAAAAGVLQPAYDTALQTAQQQQGVGLGAAQANRAALQQGAGQFAGLGQQVYGQGTNTSQQQAALAQQLFSQGATAAQVQAALGQGVQQAGLSGAQAQLGAGTLQQQTQQGGLSALYNQFQQQQGYPFQVAQFLANIAEGTGALSGSTTTSTQPVMSFFSDERLKEGIEPVGKTFDGQNIIRFNYKGDKRKRIGLSAQETEDHHPEAVGEMAGYKTVDYDKATDAAAKRGHFYKGGLAADGGSVEGANAYEGFADGGMPMPANDLGSILAAHAAMYGGMGGGGGMPGLGGYASHIAGSAPTGLKLDAAKAPEMKQVDLGKEVDSGAKLFNAGRDIYKAGDKWLNSDDAMSRIAMPDIASDLPSGDELQQGLSQMSLPDMGWEKGGRVKRADGGLAPQEGYPLDNTYQNYLAQQRIHPFTQSGLYGNPLITQGVGGAYGTQLEGYNPALKIMQVDAPAPHKYEPNNASHASYEALSKAIDAAKKRKANQDGGRVGRDVGGYVPAPDSEKPPTLATAPQPPAVKDNRMNELADVAKIAMMFANRGGRAKKAGGGDITAMPYDMGYVPEQENVAAKQIDSAKQQGGGGQGDQLMPLLGLAAHFLKNGGRANKDDGGPVDHSTLDDPGYDPSQHYNANPGLGDVLTTRNSGTFGKGLVNAGEFLGRRLLGMPDAEPAPKRWEDRAPPLPPDATDDGKPYTLGPRRESGLGISGPYNPSPRPDLPTDAAPSAAPFQLQAPDMSGLGSVDTSGIGIPKDAIRASDPGFWHRQASGLGIDLDATKDALGANVKPSPGATPTSGDDSDFFSRNQSWLVPLLHGVGAATLYPGKSLVGGLTYGAMKGAESYEDTQNQMAERQLTGAETGVAKQQQSVLSAEEVSKYSGLYPGYMPVKVNGNIRFVPISRNAGDYNANGQFVPNGQGGIGATGTGKLNYIGNTGNNMAASEVQSFPIAVKNNPGLVATSNGIINGVYQNGSRAAGESPRLLMTAKSLGDNAGALQPGAIQPMLRDVAATWNSIIDRVITDPGQRARFEFASGEQLTNAQIAEKMSEQNLAAFAHMGGQDSLGALEALKNAVPHTGMTRDAALDLSALMLMQNQRDIDRQQYFNDYGQRAKSAGAASAESYLGTNADRSFNADYSPQKYAKEQTQLRQVIASPQMMEKLTSTDDNIRRQAYAAVDSIYGPGFHRYFGGFQ